jgi:hypothetical protein
MLPKDAGYCCLPPGVTAVQSGPCVPRIWPVSLTTPSDPMAGGQCEALVNVVTTAIPDSIGDHPRIHRCNRH